MDVDKPGNISVANLIEDVTWNCCVLIDKQDLVYTLQYLVNDRGMETPAGKWNG